VRYGDEIARQLATMPQLESVKGLGYLTVEGMSELATLRNLKCLHVDLKNRRQGYDGPSGLSYLVDLGALEELRIGCEDSLSDQDLACLESLTNLRELTIGNAGATERGWASIGKLKRLERLMIMDTVSRSGLNHLSGLAHLESLNVSGPWRDDEIAILQADEGTLDLSGLPNLKDLTLSSLCLRDDDLKCLRHLPSLESLTVTQAAPLNGAFLRQLEDLPELNRLLIGGLSSCTGEDLASLNGLSKLRNLTLIGDITDAALRSLTEPLSSLETVRVETDNPVQEETVADLTASHPSLDYVHIQALRRTPTRPPGRVLPRPQSSRQAPRTRRNRRR
jgi:hypothetical protein